LGPVIAWYFQPAEHSWRNALFFGHVWWIHSKAMFDEYVKAHVVKFCDRVLGLEVENRHCEYGYTVVTVMLAAWYLDFAVSEGHTYMCVACFSQFFGRWLVNNNFHGVDWMKDVEIPGVLAIVTWSSGFHVTLIVHLVYRYVVYKAGKYIDGPDQTPEKIVLTDELKQWMADFEWEAVSESELTVKARWWDENCKDWDAKWAILRHCMMGEVDEVKKCLANGTDPNMKCTFWYDSTPIQWAASNGQIGVIIALVEAGVNPYETKCRKSYIHQKQVVKFLDELIPVAIKAAQSESRVRFFKHDKSMIFADHEAFIKEKGGEMVSVEELQKFLCGKAIMEGDDQWVACLNEKGERDWVQIGEKHHPAGRSHRAQGWGYPEWGDKLEDCPFGEVIWTRVSVWTTNDGVAA